MSQDGKRLDSREDLTYLPLETICRCQINQEVRKFIRSSYSIATVVQGGPIRFQEDKKQKATRFQKEHHHSSSKRSEKDLLLLLVC